MSSYEISYSFNFAFISGDERARLLSTHVFHMNAPGKFMRSLVKFVTPPKADQSKPEKRMVRMIML